MKWLPLFSLGTLALSAFGQKPAAKPSSTPAPEVKPEGEYTPAAHLVVVYNEKDPDSAELAQYYAGKRRIPNDRVVGLKCPTAEEITREEYDQQIADPLREIFVKNGWWKLREEKETEEGRVKESTIQYIALIRGIPLKIKPKFDAYEGDKKLGPPQVSVHNEASVDSELGILGVYSRYISGVMNNPYFGNSQPFNKLNFAPMLLACRLDAPTPQLVRRMIDDAVATESTGLRGMAYIDARGIDTEGLTEGDKWLYAAANTARKNGMPVILDSGEGLFPDSYPMSRAAVYLGWYSEIATGPFVRPGFKFERGAVAVHIHSFSGSSLRDPKRYWCAPLIAAGACATLGNVYEPFLGLTPSLDVFLDRLQRGLTFAESAYASQRFLSWMTTFVGDPLYRPFPAKAGETTMAKNEWDAFKQASDVWFKSGPDAGADAMNAASKKFSSGMIAEGLGLLQVTANQSDKAITSFHQAMTLYKNPDDVLRATVHEVFQLKASNRVPDAIAVARKQLDRFHKEPTSEVLRLIEAQMTMATTRPQMPKRPSSDSKKPDVPK